ncbi:hypothetical protein Y032_0126g1331 [Ancylostoma ceylanicum]|uniref:Uncharacterized protein n=1 Tax=Ancylostoma ceylanicum TaxID=53326 RepID=A0A016T7P0_9BILA|nr:hypothetical protein Y032_0126g1331 [Ancylostoma ceylanicum]
MRNKTAPPNSRWEATETTLNGKKYLSRDQPQCFELFILAIDFRFSPSYLRCFHHFSFQWIFKKTMKNRSIEFWSGCLGVNESPVSRNCLKFQWSFLKTHWNEK